MSDRKCARCGHAEDEHADNGDCFATIECGYRRETPDEVLRRVLLASHAPDCTGTAREAADMLRGVRARNAAAQPSKETT